jgi:hypothetical protein
MVVEYLHWANWDGTTDSICPRCNITIGTSYWEADLDRMEAAHVCDPQLRENEECRTQLPDGDHLKPIRSAHP